MSRKLLIGAPRASSALDATEPLCRVSLRLSEEGLYASHNSAAEQRVSYSFQTLLSGLDTLNQMTEDTHKC